MLFLSVLQLATAQIAPAPILEEVVVTARRQNDDSSNVPVSVEIIGSSNLQGSGIFYASDIASLTASVTISSIFGSSAPQIYLRGVGSNDVNPSANPGIAAYQNETYLASPLGQNLAAFDLDRVEILRGPQGTLFGRNATGGTLIFHTNQPDMNQGGSVSATFGSFGQHAVETSLDTGLLGSFRARFAGFIRKTDGWTKNTANGQLGNDQDAAGGRLTVVGDVLSDWTANLTVDYSVDRSGMTAHSGIGLFEPPNPLSPAPPGALPKPCTEAKVQQGVCANILGYVYGSDPYKQAYDRVGQEYLDVGGASLTLARSGSIDFRSITSYRDARRDVKEDTDASPLSIVALDFDNKSSAFTQEFLLNSNRNELDRSTWQAGAFLLNEKLSTVNRFETLGTLRNFGVAFIPDPVFFAFGPFRLTQRYTQSVQSAALFGEVGYTATAKLTLTAGARVTHETGEFNTETRFAEVIANPVLAPRRAGKVTTDALTWRIAALYKFGESRSAYATISRGFKSGGFNGGALFSSDTIGPLDPEFVIAYETGVKWAFSRALSGEISLFNNDYNGLQDFTLRATPPPSRQVLDSADAQMSGFDASLRAILPLGFTARASVAALRTQYTDYTDANGVDRSGNRLPVSPSTSTNFALEWKGQISSRLIASARLVYDQRSKIFFDNTNSPLLSSPSSQTIAVLLSLEDRDRVWRLDLSGQNLTDEQTVVATLNIANYGFIQQTYAPPRSFQIALTRTF